MAKRLRILAGPNGSGKTSIYKDLRDSFNWGVFVNADDIEHTLKTVGELNLSEFSVTQVTQDSFVEALENSKRLQKSTCTLDNINFFDGSITIKDSSLVDSYFSSFVASFIHNQLIEAGISFSLETVMSHKSKIELLRRAKENGYRIYLYYVSTQDTIINVGRVQTRVAEGGHNVEEKKIRSRYNRSLKLLYDALRTSDRAYLFDNSGKSYKLVAEYDKTSNLLTVKRAVNWLKKYVIAKLTHK